MTSTAPNCDDDDNNHTHSIIHTAARRLRSASAFTSPTPFATATTMHTTPLICPRHTSARRHRSTLVACSSSSESPPPIPSSDLTTSDVFRISLISGAAAGFTVDAILFPLDTLKTRLQLASSTITATPAGIAWLTSLYHGFGPAVLASAPAAAAFFGTYDTAKRVLNERFNARGENERYAPAFHMLAAALGDISSSTVRSPFEVVKQRMQSGMYTSATAATKMIFKKEGLGGFYTGYGSLVLRELPFDALQFPLYEWFKKEWAKSKGVPIHELQTWESCVCGSVAGGLSATVTTPLDVVKTRLMTQSIENPKYLGLVHGLKTIAKEEGPRVLMSGVVPRVLWISLGGAIFFGAYEAAKKSITPVIAQRAQARAIAQKKDHHDGHSM